MTVYSNSQKSASSLPIHMTAGNHAGPKSQRGLESYATPQCAVEALIAAERLPARIWNICGNDDDAISAVLRTHGKIVVATDIATDGINFLHRTNAPYGVQAIVANPPFSLAADFIRHGLLLVPKVVILERIQFLESDDRADIIDSGQLARVLVFSNRVPRVHQKGRTGKRAAPAMCLTWFVFRRKRSGVTLIERIRCDKSGRNNMNWQSSVTTAATDATSSRFEHFLNKIRNRGRLIFALDATASRQATWDQAAHLQAQMFETVANVGGLDVQLIYFRGWSECKASRWVSDARQLRSIMTGLMCKSGHTQIRRVLDHVRKEHQREPINAVVYVGDACEEAPADLYDSCPKVPVFVFQEGDNGRVRKIFAQIAHLTGGAHAEFNCNSALTLAELLKAVAAFATGGAKALADQNSAAARLLLTQIKK